MAALSGRQTKIATLRRLWRVPATIQEIAQKSGFAIGSVCSLKACLAAEIVEAGEREKLWADGRVTKRTVFQIVEHAR